MSRGLGKIQRMCLEVLTEQGKRLDSIEIAERALGKDVINDSEHASFRRALRKLSAKGLVVDMGRRFRFGRRHWALPEVAKHHFEHIERDFGRSALMEHKARSRFTLERFPDHA